MHGWGGSIDSFLGIAKFIGKKYRVTLVDFYGFGKTPHPDFPLFVEDYAISVVNLIRKYKMTRVTVVGHSFGGRVAIRLASKYGYLIDSIVLVDSAGLKPRRNMVYYCKVFRHKLLNKLKIAHKAGSADYQALKGVEKQTFKNVVNEDLTPELNKITLPTLIVWGDKDRDTPIYMARRMRRKIRNSGLIIFEGAGHFAYLEGHKQFVSILTNFLSDGGYEMGSGGIGMCANRCRTIKIPVALSK